MRPASQGRWLAALFLISGAPGMIAQITWIRVMSAGLGHELPAVFGVVSAYFAGLAAGAWFADGAVSRSRAPARWYAGLELLSACWIATTTPLLPSLNALALRWTGLEPSGAWQSFVAFLYPLLVVGPAAAALGGTLPAMERAVAPWFHERRAVAGLYALNTAGAVIGVWATIGCLMPQLGFRVTLWVAAAVQATCGLAALSIARSSIPLVSGVPGTTPQQRTLGPGGDAARRYRIAMITGLLGMGFELLGVRALAQTTENTIDTFAAALGMFLAGTAMGSAACRAWERRGRRYDPGRLLTALSIVCLMEMWVLKLSPILLTTFREWFGALGSEMALATTVFLAPAFLMGAIYAQVVQGPVGRTNGIGRMAGINTLGGALGGPVFIGLLLPVIGMKWAFVVLGLGYTALVVPPWRVTLRQIGRFGAMALIPLLPSRLQWLEVPPGGSVVRYIEGSLATVAVLRTADGHRALRVNNHFQQGGTATAGAARRHAHLPLLLHPDPRRVLFLGVGTGITAGAATAYTNLAIDGVELLPEVATVLSEFEPENAGFQSHANCQLHVADARRFVRCASQQYDVIVADLFHPAEDGAGFLYTREHFKALRTRLAAGGLVCQWLPLHQLDSQGLADIVRTFVEVFPGATMWLLRFNVDVPVVGLVGGDRPLRVDLGALERRLEQPHLRAALGAVGLTSSIRLLGCELAGAESLRSLGQSGVVATDDRPVVLFEAPAATYQPSESPAARLTALLEVAEPDFSGLIEGIGRGGELKALAAFRTARDLHLRGLEKETEGRRREALEDYLRSVDASADYTAGYAQAVLVAAAYAREEPDWARKILRRLVEARPEEPLAEEMLRRLTP